MNKIIDYFTESSRVIEGLKDQEENISLVVDSCVTSLKNGKKNNILWKWGLCC